MKCVHFKLGQFYWSQEVLHNKNWSHNICVICRTSTHNCIVFPNHRIALLCFFPVYIIIHLVSFNYMMTAWLSCCVLSRLLVIGLEGGANWESYSLHDTEKPIRDNICIFYHWSAGRKMSEVNLTKHKEKCENCTKQVRFWISMTVSHSAHPLFLVLCFTVQQEKQWQWFRLSARKRWSWWTGK